MSDLPNPKSAFCSQIDGASLWLTACLEQAGITGTQAKRALARLTEFKEEVQEVYATIFDTTITADLTKLTSYDKFDASTCFPQDLADRADSGIQDLAAGVHEELSQLARGRKKTLGVVIAEGQTPPPVEVTMLPNWHAANACDCIEEIGATMTRFSEAARYLFQSSFLAKLREVALQAKT